MRFLRDGHIIQPDVIISMSGVNDAGTVLNNRFNLNDKQIKDNEYITGLPSAENSYEYWLRIEKMFKLHTDSLNIKFFPFLQPMNGWFPNASVVNRLVSEFEDCEDCKDFCSNANENDIYTNLIDLFKNQPEMLIDNCHYTDKAADILSDKVLETILPTITEIYARK